MTRGYLLFAIDTANTAYNRLAYACALSIKATQPEGFNSVTIVTNDPSYYDNKHAVDTVIQYKSSEVGMSSRVLAYEYSPYDSTVFLDSDILFTRSLAHFWDAMETEELLFSSRPVNYRGDQFSYGPYRKLFEENSLPDIYTAWTFFKKGAVSKNVFDLAKYLTQNTQAIAHLLTDRKIITDLPTDESLALASVLLGLDFAVEGGTKCPAITHMKSGVQGWKSTMASVSDVLRYQLVDQMTLAGMYAQVELLHYVDKQLITDDLLSVIEGAACD